MNGSDLRDRTPENTRGSSKRKGDDGTPAQSRAKRNRYISIACNECKRRKIKCNGETPCQRCTNLSLECVYAPNCCSNGFKDSEEFRQMNDHIQSLQAQVDNLWANLNALHNRQDGTALQQFDDPNNDLNPLALAQSGYGGADPSMAQSRIVNNSPMQNHEALAHAAPPFSIAKDPIWSLRKEEVGRLCRVYDEEMGTMYPILDIESVIKQSKSLFQFMESAARTGLVRHEVEMGSGGFQDEETNILKLILATSLTVEASGDSEPGRQLYESVRTATESKLCKPVGLQGLRLLVIAAQYHFQLDEEAQAYRIIGLAARMCFEMGLHRREILMKKFKSDEELTWAVRLFWSIYVLDRRWSLGTGMPFAIQDADIDPTLPEPDEGTPYLTVMVGYGRISSKVWRSITGFEGSGNEVRRDEMGYLDYQIQQWQSTIPDSLRYQASDNTPDHETLTRNIRRLRIILYLRANHLRILIYKAVLHSATSIMENRGCAQTVVEIAKDTIRVLTRLNQTSDIYRMQQVQFNYFLVSALTVLFLAVTHYPLEFNVQVREEFYLALDLIKGFSTKSYVAKRLWQTIMDLKAVGPHMGVVSVQAIAQVEDPHSSAAVAMAGLAGHQVNELAAFPQSLSKGPIGNNPMDGQQMSLELTTLFEAAGAYGVVPDGTGIEGIDGYGGESGEAHQDVGNISGLYGEKEAERLSRDQFGAIWNRSCLPFEN